jgi:hypothetical protein
LKQHSSPAKRQVGDGIDFCVAASSKTSSTKNRLAEKYAFEEKSTSFVCLIGSSSSVRRWEKRSN